MKRAILRAFHLVVTTKVQKSSPRMELFSGIKMNSWENLAMNSTINCNIAGAIDVPEPYSGVGQTLICHDKRWRGVQSKSNFLRWRGFQRKAGGGNGI